MLTVASTGVISAGTAGVLVGVPLEVVLVGRELADDVPEPLDVALADADGVADPDDDADDDDALSLDPPVQAASRTTPNPTVTTARKPCLCIRAMSSSRKIASKEIPLLRRSPTAGSSPGVDRSGFDHLRPGIGHVPGHPDTVDAGSSGVVRDDPATRVETQEPHWFGSTGDEPAEILSIASRPGERMTVRTSPAHL